MTAKVDSMIADSGDVILGHEFHYYDTDDNGDGFLCEKKNGKAWDAVHVSDTMYAGFPHFAFYGNLKCAEKFYKACLREKHND